VSRAGVGVLLGILNGLTRLLVGEPAREVGILRKDSLEGCADTKGLCGRVMCFGGEPGELTVTSGGDRGGESGPIDTGRSLGVLERDTGPLFSPSGSICVCDSLPTYA
jgi:hypothetical protein